MLALVVFFNISDAILLRLKVKEKFRINKKEKDMFLLLSVFLLVSWTSIVIYMLYYSYHYIAQPSGAMPDSLIAGVVIGSWGFPVYYKLSKVFFLLYSMLGKSQSFKSDDK